jgi:hypothetical protein
VAIAVIPAFLIAWRQTTWNLTGGHHVPLFTFGDALTVLQKALSVVPLPQTAQQWWIVLGVCAVGLFVLGRVLGGMLSASLASVYGYFLLVDMLILPYALVRHLPTFVARVWPILEAIDHVRRVYFTHARVLRRSYRPAILEAQIRARIRADMTAEQAWQAALALIQEFEGTARQTRDRLDAIEREIRECENAIAEDESSPIPAEQLAEDILGHQQRIRTLEQQRAEILGER